PARKTQRAAQHRHLAGHSQRSGDAHLWTHARPARRSPGGAHGGINFVSGEPMSKSKRHSVRLTALLWSRFTWRHWCRSPRSSLLLMAILALGVAALFSVRLANRAAVSGFQM